MNKTAIILSTDEVAKLPQKDRPMNFRVTSEIYHAVFEAVGHASLCWQPRPTTEVFDTAEAEKCAVDLCFRIADELERLGVDPKLINDKAPPLPAELETFPMNMGSSMKEPRKG